MTARLRQPPALLRAFGWLALALAIYGVGQKSLQTVTAIALERMPLDLAATAPAGPTAKLTSLELLTGWLAVSGFCAALAIGFATWSLALLARRRAPSETARVPHLAIALLVALSLVAASLAVSQPSGTITVARATICPHAAAVPSARPGLVAELCTADMGEALGWTGLAAWQAGDSLLRIVTRIRVLFDIVLQCSAIMVVGSIFLAATAIAEGERRATAADASADDIAFYPGPFAEPQACLSRLVAAGATLLSARVLTQVLMMRWLVSTFAPAGNEQGRAIYRFFLAYVCAEATLATVVLLLAIAITRIRIGPDDSTPSLTVVPPQFLDPCWKFVTNEDNRKTLTAFAPMITAVLGYPLGNALAHA